jgi:hypothetical protein
MDIPINKRKSVEQADPWQESKVDLPDQLIVFDNQ